MKTDSTWGRIEAASVRLVVLNFGYDYLFVPPGSYDNNDYVFGYISTISSDNLIDCDHSSFDVDSHNNPQIMLESGELAKKAEEDIDNTTYNSTESKEPILECHDNVKDSHSVYTLQALYGSKAVLPLEVQKPSLGIAVINQLTTETCAKLRLEELESFEEKWLEAQQHLELYQAKMIQAHEKLVLLRTFKICYFILVLKRPILACRKIVIKFEPTWEGPFVVEKVYSRGAYQLVDFQGERPMFPIN
ncbi:uncharacterized protein LOC110036049 [Phalaenopsis equestris]|uniref:uncharacterized protein LOC110036049 n=1 Tax=Phalaenopsis equestris TaxID=78828 RepID=UPI0009E4AA0F|nr:uncharacterized protein LOC110036049 [Phalaenopsis equestris]